MTQYADRVSRRPAHFGQTVCEKDLDRLRLVQYSPKLKKHAKELKLLLLKRCIYLCALWSRRGVRGWGELSRAKMVKSAARYGSNF